MKFRCLQVHSFFFFLEFKIFNLFLAVLPFSLVVCGGYALVPVTGLLSAVASLVAGHRL